MNTLRASAQDYLAMRRSLGFKLQYAGVALRDFVGFMASSLFGVGSHDTLLFGQTAPTTY